ncbi:DUF4241 domain-containing protein [Lentzea sp. NPDC005914]|uniref:DUF4241 domain-containing protein n=1 Tax=Lentzea sp. NPDC005914 TaxID=3154572 RepID=UPI0033DD2118
MSELLSVVHCEGWDPAERKIVGLLPVAVAQQRDRAGEQYAFCLLEPESRRVVRVGEICWSAGFARLWHLDSLGRRTRMSEYRVLDGSLFRLRTREWTYTSPSQPEFAEDAAFVENRYSPDGTSTQIVEPQGKRGGSMHTQPTVDPASLFTAVPSFPDWASFAEVPSVPLVAEDPAQQSAEPPWRPAVPLGADGIERAFTPGSRWRVVDRPIVTEVVEAGTVHLPSGRLIAADPGLIHDGLKPFETTIAPGDYRVELGLLRFEDDPSHVRVTAAKLIVSDLPVATWEPALEPGEDPRLLPEGHFYGFGVDTGTGSFFDAAALAAFEQILDDDNDDDDEGLLDNVWGARTAVVPDPSSSATLVAYASGWGDGSYPTWIGRTATGEVACFVSDMLILRHCTPVAEEVMS